MALHFASPLDELIQFADMKEDLAKGRGPLAVSGCTDSQKVHLACELTADIPLRLIVTYNESRAREIYEDAQSFHSEVFLYPAKDVLFYQADVQGNVLSKQRMEILKQILEEGRGTVVTTIDACMDRIASPDEVYRRRMEIRGDSELDLTEAAKRLADLGYERLPQVELPGQFAVRGDILDIYPLTDENPVRIELWGDEVDSIRSFDAESQRSLEMLDSVVIYAADEMPPVRDGRYVFSVSVLDYFDEEAAVLLDEPARLEEKARGVSKEYQESMAARLEQGVYTDEPVPELLAPEEVRERLIRPRTVILTTLPQRFAEVSPSRNREIRGKTALSYAGNISGMIRDLKQMRKEKYRVVILSGSRTRAERMAKELQDYELPAIFDESEERNVLPGQILVTTGSVHKGFEYPDLRFTVLTESDILHRSRRKRRKSESAGKRIRDYSELSRGDYVVHENHGIGIYEGIEEIEVDGVTRDYLKITYGDGGTLFVPVTQMDLVQKYASASAEQKPRLSRLNGTEWHRTKNRVRHEVRDIADDLVRLYARRQNGRGFTYSGDTVWQREFEEQFPYEETEDQVRAIEECKADMESPKIMDRLICGDVGYGKTEIALRAAFKAVQDGKQVAYLVPTTILAQQHFTTFTERMKDYPVGIELLCRFRSAGEQKKSIERLSRGTSDIAIGTHRLLSKDVKFHDLGLLIIDEEQRFGVADKEKIKQIRDTVDVLSLTATPIPRTLHMSMIGIRDMSILEEPPMDRKPIQTYVMEYNEELVREAIQRELDRGGQVYYVFNRVRGIRQAAARIAQLVPDASVAFAHGQMNEHELEDIMLDFVNGETDVLVTTTIIETGLDISNVNTIIIQDADRFGLAQLYQLRGRVGRSSRSAYAFLMYRRDKILTETAEKRLQALREYTQLGSGIRIAMRDLEIRGAGNLLGAEQHGHMEAVGYDLYCKLLGEAVNEAQGGAPAEDFETKIDLDLDAYIPDRYIPNELQKMNLYHRIAGIRTDEEESDMRDEMIDRFGEMPKPAENLIRVARLRALAHEDYLTEITGNGGELRFLFYEKAPADVSRFPEVVGPFRGDLKLIPGRAPKLRYRDQRKQLTDTGKVLDKVREILESLRILYHSPEPAEDGGAAVSASGGESSDGPSDTNSDGPSDTNS